MYIDRSDDATTSSVSTREYCAILTQGKSQMKNASLNMHQMWYYGTAGHYGTLWKTLIDGSQASLQLACNIEGFNTSCSVRSHFKAIAN